MIPFRLPAATGRGAIGIFGGSFNPAHAGHAHAALTAQRRVGLPVVWWIVARGNPLKDDTGDFPARLASARRIAPPRKHVVSDLEMRAGLRYTVDVVAALRRRAPGVRFVWIMGSDNLRHFHRWKGWRKIASLVPIAVITRPGASPVRMTPFSRKFAAARIPEAQARLLPDLPAPAWVFLRVRNNPLSSTALRTLS